MDADADGNGVLDVDEFTSLVSSSKQLLASFEVCSTALPSPPSFRRCGTALLPALLVPQGIIKQKEEKERVKEEARLKTLFRSGPSPGGGRRRRPSLADVRNIEDVRDTLRAREEREALLRLEAAKAEG